MGRRKQDKAISAAAPTPVSVDIEGRWPVLALAAASWVLTLPIFEPHAVWLCGYLGFVPWLIALRLARRSGWVHGASMAFGLAFWCTHWRWLFALAPAAYVFACVGLALHYVVAGWMVRHLGRRRGLPLAPVFAVVWTAHDLFQSIGTLSSPLGLLSHSQVRLPVMVQIADLVGSHGVTFVVAAVNGCVADLLVQWILRRRGVRPGAWPRLLRISTMATLATVIASAAYGVVRMAKPLSAMGPLVTVVQGDFLVTPGLDPKTRALAESPPPDDELDALFRAAVGDHEADKRLVYLRLLDEAAKSPCDLIVMPEAPWSMTLNREYAESPAVVRQAHLRMQREELFSLAQRYGRPILISGATLVPQAPGDYPQVHEYNTAYLFTPGVREPRRYDKVNPVLFGEYLPFRESRRFYWLYRLINDGPWNPWGRGGKEYTVTPGREYSVLTLPAAGGGQGLRFGAAICYEDTVPGEYRKFVVDSEGAKRVDFMVTLSNGGWFGHGVQQAQHFASCVLRAVENRVWIARATNTGVSGFINPDGTWHDLVGPSDRSPQSGGMGHRTARAVVDPRVTFYSRHGDVLAWGCLVIAAVALLDAAIAARRRKG